MTSILGPGSADPPKAQVKRRVTNYLSLLQFVTLFVTPIWGVEPTIWSDREGCNKRNKFSVNERYSLHIRNAFLYVPFFAL